MSPKFSLNSDLGVLNIQNNWYFIFTYIVVGPQPQKEERKEEKEEAAAANKQTYSLTNYGEE